MNGCGNGMKPLNENSEEFDTNEISSTGETSKPIRFDFYPLSFLFMTRCFRPWFHTPSDRFFRESSKRDTIIKDQFSLLSIFEDHRTEIFSTRVMLEKKNDFLFVSNLYCLYLIDNVSSGHRGSFKLNMTCFKSVASSIVCRFDRFSIFSTWQYSIDDRILMRFHFLSNWMNSSVFWDYAISVSMLSIVYLHCHQHGNYW